MTRAGVDLRDVVQVAAGGSHKSMDVAAVVVLPRRFDHEDQVWHEDDVLMLRESNGEEDNFVVHRGKASQPNGASNLSGYGHTHTEGLLELATALLAYVKGWTHSDCRYVLAKVQLPGTRDVLAWEREQRELRDREVMS